MAAISRSVETDDRLEPFHGVLSPGLSFSSGHSILPHTYSSTPLPLAAHNELWLVTPTGDRRLYVDPSEAAPYLETYHRFDRTVGASIDWSRSTDDRVDVRVAADDGTAIDVSADLGDSIATRLLTRLSGVTPSRLLKTAVGSWISNLSFQGLLETNGLQIAGQTETGEPYRVEADTLRTVESATATLDGDDLGALRIPYRRVAFGDHVIPDDALLVAGDLYLPPPER